MAGVIERYGHQFQPPYSTINAVNVRPDSSLGGRERGGTRPGLAKFFSEQLGTAGTRQVRMLNTITWVASATGVLNSRLMAISNGKLYREQPVGTMALAATTGGTFNSAVNIHSAERNQLFYIADHAVVPADSSATYFPKVFDPAANSITAWSTLVTDGTMPTGCEHICTWRDRIVLAGGTTTPHGVFMSRQSDPYDWDYSETDQGAAVSLVLSGAGQIGDVVTALSPHSDNCLILGCASSVWIARGDPTYGTIDNLSQHLGVVDKGAWCVTPESLFVFLSQDGLYFVPASCDAGRYPESLSRERLPRQLLGIDKTVTNIVMAYDLIDRGIHIYLTPITDPGTPSSHWFFDWEGKTFWKVKHGASDHEPFTLHSRKNFYDDNSGVAMGCRDGYIRRHTHDAQDDDGTDFSSEIWLGPLGDPTLYSDTSVDELCVTLDTSSAPVRWSLHAGNSPQQAYASGAAAEGQFTAGRNNSDHPRIRGQSIYLKLTDDGSGQSWAWESGYGILSKRGKTRP